MDADLVTHPSHDDPVVEALSEGVGGPLGTRSAGHRWWTPVRVVLALTAVCIALGMVQKAGCYEETWSDDRRYTQMCYSDLPYLYTGRGMVEAQWPFSGDEQVRARYDVMEYPVGISYVAYGLAKVTHVLTGSPDVEARQRVSSSSLFGQPEVQREIRAFVIVHALLFAALALLSAWLLAGVNRGRPWDAALFALSPALALTFLVNWDMLAVVLVAGALWSWARGRPLLTGVLIGLGTATKLYPLLLLGGLVVICVRERRWRELTGVVLAGTATWLVANAPAYLTGREQWEVFWTFNSERVADLGSAWLVVSQATDHAFSAHTINLWSYAILGVWCAGVALLGLRAPTTPRFAQLAFLVVAGFLLVNKVYSPQYVLWLLPLAVLARPRWRDQLVWQAGEVLYFASVWWYLDGDLTAAGGEDAAFYWLAIAVRISAELYLCVMVVRDIWWPREDPVHATALAGLGPPGQVSSTRSNVVAV
ncbi:MAG: DUF2029 domain-containing protein [Nocardioides sp.]|nr:DUF2029 domain-containing protein [Nocardioides sp.]